MVTASDRAALTFSLSGGEKNDSPEGIKLQGFTSHFEVNNLLPKISVMNLLCLQKAIDFISGIMTEKFTNSETRLKDFFADSNVSEEFLLVMIS